MGAHEQTAGTDRPRALGSEGQVLMFSHRELTECCVYVCGCKDEPQKG